MDKVVEIALERVNEALKAIPEKPEERDRFTMMPYREAKDQTDNAIALLQAAVDAI